MIKGHRIEKRISTEEFIQLIESTKKENIHITDHALFRLKEKDRKIFKDKIVKDMIKTETPLFIGIQYNKNYALFYRYGKEILKIITRKSALSFPVTTTVSFSTRRLRVC